MGARQHSVLLVDLVGGVVTCLLAGVAVWQMFLQPNTAAAELKNLRGVLTERTRDVASLEHELGKQEVLLEERRARLAAEGAPPGQTPIEDDLRTIADVARRNHLRLTEVTPLGSVSYPGVLETRYRISGQGGSADLASVLRQFRACDFWGDITHVQIGQVRESWGPGADVREMNLTVSFYSATSDAHEPAGTG